MPGRVHEIFALNTLLAKIEALHQLASEVYESREDHIHLTTGLPHILNQLFCEHDGHSPWIESEAYEDKQALIELLHPSGPLLKHLILRRFDQDVRYEFPVDLLPHPFQLLIKERKFSSLPPLLKSRLAEKNAPSGYLILNTWEFYLFYFASYAVHFRPDRPAPRGASKVTAKKEDNSSFLPGFVTGSNLWNRGTNFITRNGVVEEERDERVEDSHAYCYLLEDYMRFFVFKSFEEEHRRSKVAMSFLDGDYYSSVSQEFAVLSSNLLEITLECYLNIYDWQVPSEYVVPSDLLIESLTISLKALLRGLRSIRVLEYGPASVKHSVRGRSGFFKTSQEDLFQQLFLTTVRNRLYLFFIRAFGYAYWSSATMALLRYIVEIWCMLIRPWALGRPSWMEDPEDDEGENSTGASSSSTGHAASSSSSSSSSSEGGGKTGSLMSGLFKAMKPAHLVKQLTSLVGNKIEKDQKDKSEQKLPLAIEQARRDYILGNFVLYTPILSDFLQMSQRFNLGRKKELKIVSLATSTWCFPDLLLMVGEIDTCIKKTHDARADSVAIPHNIESVANAAREVLKSAAPNWTYLPLRGSVMVNAAQILGSKIERHVEEDASKKMKELQETTVLQVRDIFDLKTRASPIAFNLDSDDNRRGGDSGSSGGNTTSSSKFSTRATAPQRVMNVDFSGDNRLRPISGAENRFLVRRAFELSTYIKRRYKLDLDLRVLGAYKVYVWIAALAILMLIVMGFTSFISSIEFDDSYDNSYTYEYGGDYNYHRQQARQGGYR